MKPNQIISSAVLAIAMITVVLALRPSSKNQRFPASDASEEEVVSEQIAKDAEQDSQVRGGHPHFQKPMTAPEAADFWHLSEGSEVFPMKWLVKMKDQMGMLKQSTYLYERLDEKFGVTADHIPSDYPIKWVGLTSAWSGLSSHNSVTPDNSDVHLVPGQSFEEIANQVRVMRNGEKSVAMVGVNCTFCHATSVKMSANDSLKVIDGAPSMSYIRGFFQDLFGSAMLTMLDEKALTQFLNESGVLGDNKGYSREFVKHIKQELELPSGLISQIENWALGEILNRKQLVRLGSFKLQPYFFQHQLVIKKYLSLLFKKSYGIPENENLPKELDVRMDWLAKSIGYDPKLSANIEDGYARTDAFGRISDMIARGNYPIPLDAPVSLPMMWSSKYRSVFHYNGNTNSVPMRNIGQSFGLGSIQTDPVTHDSTVNISNLHKIETLLYKVKVPNGSQFFSQIDINKAMGGCQVFYKNCAGCHEVNSPRVGPTNELINYKVIPIATLTKKSPQFSEIYAHYSALQSTPLKATDNGREVEIPFREGLFGFTGAIRQRYYEVNKVDTNTQREWEHLDLRGDEVFRDTYLAQSTNTTTVSATYMNNITEPKAYGYVARNLSGVWATAPYLHNGSVPTVYDLLTPAEKRPKFFYVGSHLIDTKKLGYASDLASTMQELKMDIPKIPVIDQFWLCKEYPERCFDVSKRGNDNHGHEFGTDLDEASKYNLIEFLKILRPEVEYSWNQPLLYRVIKESGSNEVICKQP